MARTGRAFPAPRQYWDRQAAAAAAGGAGITIDLAADPALASWSAVDPTAILGSITIDLAADPATATWSAIDPTVVLGSLILDLSGDPAIATWSAVDPTVILGSVTVDLSGDPALASWSAIDPTVVLGSLTLDLSGDPAIATWSAVDPTVIIFSGTLDLSGDPAVAAWSAADPVTMRARRSLLVGTGTGYTDVSAEQLIRTQQNRVYLFAVDCAAYPCEATNQTIRAYKADQDGIPSSFTRMDSADEHSGIAGWAVGLDSAGLVHVAWTYRTVAGNALDGLRYATYNTLTDQWATAETIISGGLTDGVGQGVQTVALAVDASDVPHIVYLSGNGTARRIYYRNRSGGSWSAATQLDTGVSYTGNLRAWHPNLIFDTAGNRVAAWERGSFNATADGTIYARVYKSGAWQTEVNVSGDNGARTVIDQSTSMMTTPDGTIHLTFVEAVNDYIRYYYSTNAGDSWTANNPLSGTQATHNPSLGPGSVPNTVRIYGHGTPSPGVDDHGDNLYYVQGPGGASAWTNTWVQYLAGTTFDSSINTRWCQYHYWHRGYLDIAYWADPYPNDLYYGVEDVSIPIDVAADPATANWSAADPTVIIGALIINLSGDPAIALWSAADPVVILGSIALDLSGDVATAAWSAVDPAVVLGSLTLDIGSLPATAAWSATNPNVVIADAALAARIEIIVRAGGKVEIIHRPATTVEIIHRPT